MIGVAPLPNANSAEVVAANSVVVPLEFAAAGGRRRNGAGRRDDVRGARPRGERARGERAGRRWGIGGPTATAPLPHTGPVDGLPVVVIAGSALLLLGAAVLLLVPGRRRNGGQA